MLKITVPEGEYWDETKEQFINIKECVLTLEHSLVSIAKWESKWGKPFLSKESKTTEEVVDYIRCMTITQNVNPDIYSCLTPENYREINTYIESPMSATTINERGPRGGNGEMITSELIYYWMVAFRIPFECQKWHINRLLTLIRICNIKNQPPKKMSQKAIMSRNDVLNRARRQRLKTKG